MKIFVYVIFMIFGDGFNYLKFETVVLFSFDNERIENQTPFGGACFLVGVGVSPQWPSKDCTLALFSRREM
jgi:hypothetical protein